MTEIQKKKRKTLDEHIGVNESNTNWILLIAIFTSIFAGGILSFISIICGLYGGYYTIKQVNNPKISNKTKVLRFTLLIIWFIIYGTIANLVNSSN